MILDDKTFWYMLEWFMVSDPWVLSEEAHKCIQEFLDSESINKNYENWIDAYHELGWDK